MPLRRDASGVQLVKPGEGGRQRVNRVRFESYNLAPIFAQLQLSIAVDLRVRSNYSVPLKIRSKFLVGTSSQGDSSKELYFIMYVMVFTDIGVTCRGSIGPVV